MYLVISDLANRIREDKSILVPEEFNAAKTWTEYINRLIGVISGFFYCYGRIIHSATGRLINRYRSFKYS